MKFSTQLCRFIISIYPFVRNILFYENTSPAMAKVASGADLNPHQSIARRPCRTGPHGKFYFYPRARAIPNQRRNATHALTSKKNGRYQRYYQFSPHTTNDHLHEALPIDPRNFFLDRVIAPKIRDITIRLKEPPARIAQARPPNLKHHEKLPLKLKQTKKQRGRALPGNPHCMRH